MHLPFVESPSDGARTSHAPAASIFGKESQIVVIDDDPSLASIISRYLEAEGFVVESFQDPQQAIDILLQRQMAPALIISDVVMPIHNGYEVAARVRGRFPAVQFVFVSGFISSPCPGREPDGFMTKPVDRDLLLTRVRHLTGRTK
jgi:DNA-binding response OmpR family regulator